MSDKQFEILSQETLSKRFFSLEHYTVRHTLFQGGWTNPIGRELFRRSNCVGVVLYDPKRDEVVLIEQFRIGAIFHSTQPWLLEIVAGAMEEDETAEDVAHREAMEEAGCQIQQLIKINEFYTSPGGSSERLALFCGIIDSLGVGGIHGLDDEDEDIRVMAVPFEEAYRLLEQGRIDSGIPIIAIQWLFIHREHLRQAYSS